MDSHPTPARPVSSTARTLTPHKAAFIENLEMIYDVIRAVCRRGRVTPSDEEEFTSLVILKLIGNDYRIFREFRDDGAELSTYLFKVIDHHLSDYRNSEWGRWRASKPAQALGPAALQLERLVYRDRTPVREAAAIVANDPRYADAVSSTRAARSLFAKLPVRKPAGRRNEPLEAANDRAADPQVDAVEQSEQRRDAARVRDALVSALRQLTDEERRLLRRRYQRGESVAEIAAQLKAEPQALYRRYGRILKRLSAELRSQGLSKHIVRSLLGHAGDELDAVLQRMCASGSQGGEAGKA